MDLVRIYFLMKINNILHTTCASFHTSSNEFAERAVPTVKIVLKKMEMVM